MTKVLPQFFPRHWLDNPGIVFRDFPSRIRIGYVLREGGSYSYLMEPDFAKLQLSLEALHTAALSNLAELGSAEIKIGKVPGGAEGWISAQNDNFGAVRILLPAVQRIFTEALGNEFLLSIPHRDDCLCWSLAQTAERQQKHIREAVGDFRSDEYNLTPDILKFSNGAFHLHLENPF
jgi:uncharacterized protein YtpQ (UPF0354 family)